ncbi:hypothetical protein C3495_01695 [Clostridiaceae bacterium 14S0207]|nr:hypothetical protein C3495_01695 [Clostridiaceae bacterium 14S0207]
MKKELIVKKNKQILEKIKFKKLKENKINNKNVFNKLKLTDVLIFILVIILGFNIYKILTVGKKDTLNSLESLKSMSSYTSKIDIIMKNNKEEILYSGEQKYKRYQGSKLELEKNTYFFKNDKIYVKDNKGKIYEEKSQDGMYKLCFIEQYLQYLYLQQYSKEKNIEYEGKTCQVFKFEVPMNNSNLQKACVILDKKEKIPKMIKVFNRKGEETLIVKYKEFLKNIQLDNDQFKI